LELITLDRGWHCKLVNSDSNMRIVLVGLCAIITAGCGGLSTVEPPDVDADEAAAAAIAEYDSDGDEFLSAEELSKLPALKLASCDTDSDKKVSADEIAARIRQWSEGETGILSFYCNVTLDGAVLEGAEVTLDPEAFLGDAVKPAKGTMRSDGAILKIDPKLLPADQQLLRGVQPGLYKVRITHPTKKIPARYNTQTTLGQEVLPGTTGASYVLRSS
jgi:hypothetical protein